MSVEFCCSCDVVEVDIMLFSGMAGFAVCRKLGFGVT